MVCFNNDSSAGTIVFVVDMEYDKSIPYAPLRELGSEFASGRGLRSRLEGKE